MKRKASTLLFTVLITLSCSWMNQQPGGGVDFPLDNLKSFPVALFLRIGHPERDVVICTGLRIGKSLSNDKPLVWRYFSLRHWQAAHGVPPALSFFSRNSRMASFASTASANNRFSFAFSTSRAFSRLASSTCKPQYLRC